MNAERAGGPRGALRLALLAAVAASALAALNAALQGPIAAAEDGAHRRLLAEVLPGAAELDLQPLPIPTGYRSLLGLADGRRPLYLARRGAQPVAVVVPALAPGYGGAIALLIGIDLDGSVTGVRVVSHRETPGLGDAIELRRSRWILGFDGKRLDRGGEDSWRLRRDGGQFDGFTGATITSRAVVHQVQRALRYFAEDRDRLLRAAANPEPAP